MTTFELDRQRIHHVRTAAPAPTLRATDRPEWHIKFPARLASKPRLQESLRAEIMLQRAWYDTIRAPGDFAALQRYMVWALIFTARRAREERFDHLECESAA